jgi:hypothetical protein
MGFSYIASFRLIYNIFLMVFFLGYFLRLKFTYWKSILEMYVFFFGWCFFFSFCWAWRHSVVSDSDSNCRFVDERKEDDCRGCSLEGAAVLNNSLLGFYLWTIMMIRSEDEGLVGARLNASLRGKA